MTTEAHEHPAVPHDFAKHRCHVTNIGPQRERCSAIAEDVIAALEGERDALQRLLTQRAQRISTLQILVYEKEVALQQALAALERIAPLEAENAEAFRIKRTNDTTIIQQFDENVALWFDALAAYRQSHPEAQP